MEEESRSFFLHLRIRHQSLSDNLWKHFFVVRNNWSCAPFYGLPRNWHKAFSQFVIAHVYRQLGRCFVCFTCLKMDTLAAKRLHDTDRFYCSQTGADFIACKAAWCINPSMCINVPFVIPVLSFAEEVLLFIAGYIKGMFFIKVWKQDSIFCNESLNRYIWCLMLLLQTVSW